MPQLQITGFYKSMVQLATNPEILVYTNDISSTTKTADIIGDQYSRYQYQIDIDGNVVKNYNGYSSNITIGTVTIPPALISSVLKGQTKNFVLTLTTIQNNNVITKNTCAINIYSKTNFSRTFNGSNKIDFQNPSMFQINQGTLEVVFSTTSISSLSKIGGKRGAYVIPTLDNIYADGKCHIVSYVFDNGLSNGTLLYVDGKYISSDTILGMSQLYNLTIGKMVAEDGFAGNIEEVRLFNIKLPQSNINQYMGGQLQGNEIGLIGYWRLSGLQGNITLDSSGNNNFGTYYGTIASKNTGFNDMYNSTIIIDNLSILPRNVDDNVSYIINKPLNPVDNITLGTNQTPLGSGNQFLIPINISDYTSINDINNL